MATASKGHSLPCSGSLCALHERVDLKLQICGEFLIKQFASPRFSVLPLVPDNTPHERRTAGTSVVETLWETCRDRFLGHLPQRFDVTSTTSCQCNSKDALHVTEFDWLWRAMSVAQPTPRLRASRSTQSSHELTGGCAMSFETRCSSHDCFLLLRSPASCPD